MRNQTRGAVGRLLTVVLIAAGLAVVPALPATPAGAVTPPDLPLPPCTVQADDTLTGACGRSSPFLDVSFSGVFGDSSRVTFNAIPTIPPCHSWTIATDTFEPSPCYQGVELGRVVGGNRCWYIDVADDQWKDSNCNTALYTEAQTFGAPHLQGESDTYVSPTAPTPTPGCGAHANFFTYALGGPANDSNAIWSAKGPTALECRIDYLGEQPDGLWGPTWIKMQVGLRVIESGDEGRGEWVYTDVYVPVDGDLRDRGPAAGYRVSETSPGTFEFTNKSVHPTDDPMTYAWDFDDGATSTEKNPTHEFSEAGVYRVKLTATDSDGDSDEYTADVVYETDTFTVELDVLPGSDGLRVGEPATARITATNAGVSARTLRVDSLPAFTGPGTILVVPPASLEAFEAPLAGGDSRLLNLTVWPQRGGDYTGSVTMTATHAGSAESDTGTTEITVAESEVPLRVEVVDPPEAAAAGTQISLDVKVTNIDTVDIDGFTVESIVGYSGPELSGGTRPNGGALAAGESRTVTVNSIDVEEDKDGAAGYVVPVVGTRGDTTGLNVTLETVRVIDEPFTWKMVPRFEPDRNDILPYLTDPEDLNPDRFEIEVTMDEAYCEAGLEFEVAAAPLELLDRDSCTLMIELAEGEYEIDVTADGDDAGTVAMEVDDLLIVVIGDSVASGEGNNHVPGGFRGPELACARSQAAAGAQAAATIEAESDATSVTFLHLACSGASMRRGLLAPQESLGALGIDQLALLEQKIDREIDALVIQVGANDMAFGSIVGFCNGPSGGVACNKAPFMYVEAFEDMAAAGSTRGVHQPGQITTGLCDAISPGDTRVGVEMQVADPSDDQQLFQWDPRGWDMVLNPARWDYTTEDRSLATYGQDQELEINKHHVGTTGCETPLVVGYVYEVEPAVDIELPRSLLGIPQRRTKKIGRLTYKEVQPQQPAVLLRPPVLEEWVELFMPGLSERYADLNSELEPFDVKETFILEYPDELTGDDGDSCSSLGRLDIDHREVEWARANFLQPLNQQVHAAATAHSWTPVGNIEAGFRTHGYCANTDRWVITLDDSVHGDASLIGALHPNEDGHGYMATQLVDAIRGDLENAAADPVEPPPDPDARLRERAEAGNWHVALSEAGFDIGDVVIINPGSIIEEALTIGGFGSLVFTTPLQYDHPVGTRVIRSLDNDGGAGVQSFIDVAADRWYSDSVVWASAGEITTGVAPGFFAPHGGLTRAQLITFIWRTMGSPASSADVPFTDLRPGAFYEEAVRWAYEADLTTGTSATEFSPDDPVTRAQAATLLWRLAGEPVAESDDSFGDVELGRFFTAAIAWMMEEQLTTGVAPTRFGPDLATTRAMAVTFLFRAATGNSLSVTTVS